MNIRKVIRKRIRHEKDGVQIAGDINAVISANVDEVGSHSHVSSRQRIVQRSGKRKATKDQRKGGE
jgi:hypothetical protein